MHAPLAGTTLPGNVVAVRPDARVAPDATRFRQLEMENEHLKQLVGTLSLEKKLLLERLSEVRKKN